MRAAWILAGLAAACGSVDGAPDATPADAGPDAEACTTSTPGAVPADEDGDGAVDEGCAWHVGEPQWLTAALPAAPRLTASILNTYVAAVSVDGLRVHVGACHNDTTGCEIHRMTRAAVDQPFAQAVPLAAPAWAGYSVRSVTLSADELELIASATLVPVAGDDSYDLYRATRGATDEAFGALALLDGLSTAGAESSPDLSRDGLELVWSVQDTLYQALRTSPTGAFGLPTAFPRPAGLDLTIQPSLSPDRRTLLFAGAATGAPVRIYRAARATPTTVALDDVTQLTELDPTNTLELVRPRLSEGTRELFFASDQPWAPSRTGAWRAQTCRDGACTSATVPCDGGVRSDDGLHCYARVDTVATWSAAEADCASRGGHLVSIHSAAEQALVYDNFSVGQPGTGLWLGGFDDAGDVAECNTQGQGGTAEFPCPFGWTSGEPWLFTSWQGSNPNNAIEDAVQMNRDDAGQWADLDAASTRPYVCETVLHPTW